jgi:hypothetical protein
LAATKRDDFKNTSTREVSYFLRNLFDDINASNKN